MAQTGELFQVLDVPAGGGLGVPCHNVGQQPDLPAGTVQQVLDKARVPGQDLVPQTHVSCSKEAFNQIGECTPWYIVDKFYRCVPCLEVIIVQIKT